MEDAAPAAIAVENVAVVDVRQGRVIAARTVLIRDRHIAAIEEAGAVALPADAVRVDGSGLYLMPGLVDMHVHLFNNASHRPPNDWAFPLFVANGVTAVREMSASAADIPRLRDWRALVEGDELIAPRVVAAGIPVREESPDAARLGVQRVSEAGGDFVKIFSDVPAAQWRAIVDEARTQRIPLCGHTPANETVLTAAASGLRSNEHLTQVYEACSDNEKQFLAARADLEGAESARLREAQERQVLAQFNQRACERTAVALAKTGQAQVPTLVLPHFEHRGVRTEMRDDSRWRYLRRDEQARWERLFEEHAADDGALAAARSDVSQRIVQTLHSAGVRILAGTDSPMPLVYPGFSLHKELELLVQAGLTPADALRAATLWPAEFLGQSDTSGSIDVGKRADLVLLGGNPLCDITQTQSIRAVVLNGRLWQRAELDSLLERSATRAAAK